MAEPHVVTALVRRRRPAFVERLRGGGRGVLWRIGKEATAAAE